MHISLFENHFAIFWQISENPIADNATMKIVVLINLNYVAATLQKAFLRRALDKREYLVISRDKFC